MLWGALVHSPSHKFVARAGLSLEGRAGSHHAHHGRAGDAARVSEGVRMLTSRRLLPLALLTGLLVVLLAACSNGKVTELQSQVDQLTSKTQALQSQNQDLQGKNDALAKQITDLKAQVADLSLTEANLYAQAQGALKKNDLDTAEATLKKLLDRYPNGTNAATAKADLATITEKRADKVLGQARWYANDGQFGNAQALYQQVIDKYPDTKAVSGARSGLNDLSTLKAQAAAAKAGFLISDMNTYWTGSPQSNGQNLIIPEVRFHVKPSTSKPITYLELKAVYFLDKNGSMEQFGSGETWVVGSDDIPLQPGTSKESWIESDTGYVDNGISQVGWDLLAGKGPATRADLYYRTDIMDGWTKFDSVDVTPQYKF